MSIFTPENLKALDALAGKIKTICDLWEKHQGHPDQSVHGRRQGGGADSATQQRPGSQEEGKEDRNPKEMVSVDESETLSADTIANGGFTYHPINKNSPTEGFSVSQYKEREVFIPKPEDITPEIVKAYADRNADIFLKDPQAHLGGWFNKEDTTDKLGRFFKRGVYLDVVHVVNTKKEAHDQVQKINDAAYFDLKNFETVYLGDDADWHEGDPEDKKSSPAKTKQAGTPQFVHFIFPRDISPEEAASDIRRMVKDIG